jgi:retron-type reverse transcriptase
MSFTNLAHHIDIAWLLEAYVKTRKDGAVGVDGQTAEEYEVDLWGNLQRLLDRAKSGTFVAPPVRRVHIPVGAPGEQSPGATRPEAPRSDPEAPRSRGARPIS